MAKAYRTLAVSIILPEDEDIARLVDSLPRGTVSPWIKQAIRKYALLATEQGSGRHGPDWCDEVAPVR